MHVTILGSKVTLKSMPHRFVGLSMLTFTVSRLFTDSDNDGGTILRTAAPGGEVADGVCVADG